WLVTRVRRPACGRAYWVARARYTGSSVRATDEEQVGRHHLVHERKRPMVVREREQMRGHRTSRGKQFCNECRSGPRCGVHLLQRPRLAAQQPEGAAVGAPTYESTVSRESDELLRGARGYVGDGKAGAVAERDGSPVWRNVYWRFRT